MKKTHLLLLVLLGIQLFFLVNLQFTAWPEMFSYPYLRNNGFLLYRDMIHPYPPVLTMGLSFLYSLFGYSLPVLQKISWIVILASSVAVFLVIKQLTRRDNLAILGLGMWVLLQPFLEGNMLWFDIAIVPTILIGLYFALRNNWFLSGVFLSVAMLTKQTTGLFYVGVIVYLLATKAQFNQIKKFLLAPFILGIPLLIRLLQEGALADFLNWTLVYPLTRFGEFPGYVQMSLTGNQLAIVGILLIPLLTVIILRPKSLHDSHSLLLGLFLVAGLISIYPRFSFFHFQAALAFIIVFYVYLLRNLKFGRAISVAAMSLLVLSPLIHQPTLARDWQKEARFYGQGDMELARIIKNAVSPGGRVFLLGLPSGFYSMAGILPPKRWTDNFGWYLEIPGVQEEILGRWTENPPAVVFWRTPSPGSWFDLGTYQPKRITAWIEEHYTKEREVKPGIWLWREKELVVSGVEP